MRLEHRTERAVVLAEAKRNIAEAIRFYEKNLPKEALKECKVAEGTEYYARALVQKYMEIKKWG